MAKITKTKNGKIAKETKNIAVTDKGHFIKYYTEEELAEEKRLYTEKAKYPEIDLEFLINVEITLKNRFAQGLKRVLEYIEPNFTDLWVEKQSMVSRINIRRILKGTYAPSIQNFFRLLYFIERHIDNFNVWTTTHLLSVVKVILLITLIKEIQSENMM